MDNLTQDELIDIARNGSDWNARADACEKIRDENALKDIFRYDSIVMVKIKAVYNICDVDFLYDECLNNPQGHIRHAILNRILDEKLLNEGLLNSLLAKITLNDPEKIVRQVACRNLSDDFQEIFIYLALNSSDDELRCEAISKIRDANTLKYLALNDENRFVRLESVLNPNMVSIDTLVEIIGNDEDEFNRFSALSKIIDSDLLSAVIFNKSLYHRLSEISQNITFSLDDFFIRELECADDEYRRIVAVNFLQDSSLLEKIVENTDSEKIIANAISNKHFKNQKILHNLIEEESHPEIILAVADKIDDKRPVMDYVKRHLASDDLIFKLILKITDIDFLSELAFHENRQISCHAARQLIKLKYHLFDIALNHPVKEIRIEAIGQITNRYDLVSIAHKDRDRDIVIAALNSLLADKLINRYLPHRSIITDSLNEIMLRNQLDDLVLNDDIEIQKLAVSKLNRKEKLDEIISSKEDRELVDVARKRLDSLWHDLKLIDDEEVLGVIAQKGDGDIKSAVALQIQDLKTWRDRISKINDISNINQLKDIANNDYNYYVRCEAEGRLENLLFDIRLDEISITQNQEKLKTIADDGSYPLEIRNKAILKITDKNYNPEGYNRNLELQKLLEDIAKNDDNDFEERCFAIDEICDEEILYGIVKNDYFWPIRAQATKNIKNKEMLSDISLNDSNYNVIFEAIVRIDDDEVFKKLLRKEKFWRIQEYLIKKIDDVEFLKDYANMNASDDICDDILLRIRDLDYYAFAKMLEPKFDIDLRIRACKYIKHDFFLNNVVTRYDSPKRLKMEALKYITTPNYLEDIIIYQDLDLAKIAISKMSKEDLKNVIGLCSNEYTRREICKLMDDEDLLRIIAFEDSDCCVRLIAVSKIQNQETLACLALYGTDDVLRQKAISKLNNQRVLKDIAFDDFNEDIRLAAVARITDENTLYKIALRDSNIHVCALAVYKIHNENLLKNIVLSNDSAFDNKNIRLDAIKKINDDEILASIVLNSQDYIVRMKAVSKICDNEILYEIIQNEYSGPIVDVAVEKITDDKVLEKLVLEKYIGVSDVLEKICDENFLMNLVLNSESREIRNKAFSAIENELNLTHIVCMCDDWKIRRNAIEKIQNEAFLLDVCCNSQYGDVLFEAVGRIENEDILIRVVYNASDDGVRKSATLKIKNKTVLKDLARNDKNHEIRDIAKKLLHD